MAARIRGVALAPAVAILVAGPAAAGVAPKERASGESIARDLRAGRAVSRANLRVGGDLDLVGVDAVRKIFKCRECIFEGRVTAPDVVFERVVDLSGSTFVGALDFRGATFRAPALFRSTTEDSAGTGASTTFQAPVDFSLTAFDEFASFGGALFTGPATFRDARFADAAFASTTFATAAFDRASFRGAALFNGANFVGAATFEEADFRRRTDFSLGTFLAGASFSGAQFGQGATFLKTQFHTLAEGSDEPTEAPEEQSGAWFQGVAAAGDLNFAYAEFHGLQAPPDTRVAVFEDVVCSGSLVFRDAMFADDRPIGMTRVQVRALVLDVDVVERIDEEEQRRIALRTIEESAKARGDLQAANEARYALRARESEDYSSVGRALDYVFYRGVAGYLVRPAHPLTVLLALVSLVSLVRARRLSRADDSSGGTRPRLRGRLSWRRAKRSSAHFLGCLLDTLGRAAPRLGGGGPGDAELGERVERLTYRVLAVCALIGLANSNPTLREMVDTLF